MSRNIVQKASISLSEEELEARQTEKSKLLITSYRERICALLIQKNRLMDASFFSRTPGKLGAVYIGKVKNIAKNMDACFVEIEKGEICFLPLKNAVSPWLLNRTFDGRILEGDEILVQVVRDAQKNKRASVTAHISLANEYFVLAMGEPRVGYSSKLQKEQKKMIRKYFRENGIFDLDKSVDSLNQDPNVLLSQEDAEKGQIGDSKLLLNAATPFPPTGMIVRTKTAEAESAEALLEPFYELSAQFISLLSTAKHRSCFSCIKSARTDFDAIFQQFGLDAVSGLDIITDQEDLYKRMQSERGASKEKSTEIHLYQDKLLSLSALYSVDKKLETALSSRVWLKSGAYLVIEPTEALTVIDVNSGKYESGREAGDAYRRINLEAAEEVAHQLRLRNLSGIIIVDFINMQQPGDKRDLLRTLRELTAKDTIPTKVVDITPLGLVEITRKKVNKSLQEQFVLAEHMS